MTKRLFTCIKADVLSNISIMETVIDKAEKTEGVNELVYFLQKNKDQLEKISLSFNEERNNIILEEAKKDADGNVITEIKKDESGNDKEFIVYENSERVESRMLDFYKSPAEVSVYIDEDKSKLLNLVNKLEDLVVKNAANRIIYFIYEFSE